MKKINVEKMKSVLEKASDFEKHVIQELIKMFLYGEVTGRESIQFLVDYEILEESTKGDVKRPFVQMDSIGKKCLTKQFIAIRWDYRGSQNNANFYGTQSDWNRTIVEKIKDVAMRTKIHEGDLGDLPPNTILVSPAGSVLIEDLENFHADYEEGENIIKLGMFKRYVVYCASSIVDENKIVFCRSKENSDQILEFSEEYGHIIIDNLIINK